MLTEHLYARPSPQSPVIQHHNLALIVSQAEVLAGCVDSLEIWSEIADLKASHDF